MKAQLLSFTPDPEVVVAAAARVCYSPQSGVAVMERLTLDEARRLVRRLTRSGHLSPLEHASFTFAVDVSRVCSHQLVRHRIASYSHQSQRYVNQRGFSHVVPPSVRRSDEGLRVFRDAVEQCRASYEKLVKLGIPEEDARFVLPGAVSSSMVVTMNARELRHFFRVRLCRRAQWEIRFLAASMLQKVRAVAPSLFEGVGPPCVELGVCHEGDLSCGRLRRLRAEGEREDVGRDTPGESEPL